MKIERAIKPYTRKEVEQDTTSMYIFTDNTDRDSGKTPIPNDSWYSKKYGEGKHYPTMTTALIRGLNNAYPITTQRWYNKEHKGINGRWNDEDFEEFKKVIDNDFEEIHNNKNNYEKIIFPINGIFNSKISQINKIRTPKLYAYLMTKCKELN
jgi:hypothetical protein